MKGAFGGKTGYTSLAGNTLVTFASRNGMTLVAVVLNGHQTHYSDTKAMLDFGFSNFQTSRISDLDSRFSSLGSDMSIAGLPTGDLSGLALEEGMITLPLTSSISDADVSVTYDLGERAPDNAIAQVQYTYNDRVIGSAYLLNRIGEAQETTITLPETTAADSGTSGSSADGETPAAGDSGAEAPSPAQSADGGSSSAPDSQNSGSGSQGSTGGFAIPSVCVDRSGRGCGDRRRGGRRHLSEQSSGSAGRKSAGAGRNAATSGCGKSAYPTRSSNR